LKRQTKAAAIIDRIIDVCAFLCGVVIIWAMLSVSFDVFMRAVLNRPIAGMLEINEYALLFATFLGTAWVLRADRHVTVDMAVNQLRPKARAIQETFISILGAVACALLAWYSAQATWDHFVRGAHNPGAILRVPTAFVIGIIPIGSLLLVIQFIRRASEYLEKWRTLSHG